MYKAIARVYTILLGRSCCLMEIKRLHNTISVRRYDAGGVIMGTEIFYILEDRVKVLFMKD